MNSARARYRSCREASSSQYSTALTSVGRALDGMTRAAPQGEKSAHAASSATRARRRGSTRECCSSDSATSQGLRPYRARTPTFANCSASRATSQISAVSGDSAVSSEGNRSSRQNREVRRRTRGRTQSTLLQPAAEGAAVECPTADTSQTRVELAHRRDARSATTSGTLDRAGIRCPAHSSLYGLRQALIRIAVRAMPAADLERIVRASRNPVLRSRRDILVPPRRVPTNAT